MTNDVPDRLFVDPLYRMGCVLIWGQVDPLRGYPHAVLCCFVWYVTNVTQFMCGNV